MIYPVAVSYHRFSFLSLNNSGFMSQARRMWHFSHASHSFRTSCKMPSLPRLAHKAPVMQAIHFFVSMLSFLTNITFYYLNQFNRARFVSINNYDFLNGLLCRLDPAWLNQSFCQLRKSLLQMFLCGFLKFAGSFILVWKDKKKIMISLPRHISLSSYWRKLHCCKSWF